MSDSAGEWVKAIIRTDGRLFLSEEESEEAESKVDTAPLSAAAISSYSYPMLSMYLRNYPAADDFVDPEIGIAHLVRGPRDGSNSSPFCRCHSMKRKWSRVSSDR